MRLHIARLGQGQREFRVDQCCKRAAVGHKLMGKLYPIRPHFLAYIGTTDPESPYARAREGVTRKQHTLLKG